MLVICEAAKFCDKKVGSTFGVKLCEFKVPYEKSHTSITHCTHVNTYRRSIHDVDRKYSRGCVLLIDYIPDDTYLVESLDELSEEREQNHENSLT